MYGDSYGYRSGLNSSMVDHLTSKVEGLKQLVSLEKNDLVVDIGSNDGTLLRAYGETKAQRVGIDPVAQKFLDFYPDTIQVIPIFFSRDLWIKNFGRQRAKMITSIAMFYDIEDPLTFMREIHDCLDENGIWHFEQSYMPLMLKACAYDTICHEHIEYYALRQIDWMVRRAGLKFVDIQTSDVNGGSIAVTVARKSAPYQEATTLRDAFLSKERAGGFEGMQPFADFRTRIYQHREELLHALHAIRDQGRKVLGYGASTKGNVLLQFCALSPAEIPCIGEVNPDKFGRFTPGTHIPIVSEEEMHAMQPDVLLVLPWHFRDHLLKREHRFLSRGGQMLFPLPVVQTVSR